MSNILSKTIFNNNNTIDMRNKWEDEYVNTCNRHTPFKEIRVKDRYNARITSDIIKLMYKWYYIVNKAIINNNHEINLYVETIKSSK